MKNFFPKDLRGVLICLLLLSLIALTLRIFASAGRIEAGVGQTTLAAQSLVTEAQGAITDYRRTAEENSRAITATIELGAVANGTFRLLNRQLLPRLMRGADNSAILLSTLNDNAVTLNRTIANLDSRVNGKEGVLDAAIALIRGMESVSVTLGVTTRTVERMVGEIGGKSGLVLDELWELVADPKLQQLLANATITSGNIARTSEKVDASMESVRLALESAPGIAKNLERISTVTSKYARLQILVTILASVARAFLP